MLKFCIIRASCYILAVVTLISVWYFSDAGAAIVNQSLRVSTAFVKAVARVVASFANAKVAHAEQLAVDSLHLHRTLVLGVLMLGWVFVIAALARSHPFWQVRRALLALTVVHLALLTAWICVPDPTSAFYSAHEDFVGGILTSFNAPRTETFLKELKLHGFLISLELLVVYSLMFSAMERASERRHAAWTSLGR